MDYYYIWLQKYIGFKNQHYKIVQFNYTCNKTFNYYKSFCQKYTDIKFIRNILQFHTIIILLINIKNNDQLFHGLLYRKDMMANRLILSEIGID